MKIIIMRKKVLIIKDDNVFNSIIKKHFQKKDYDVEITTNGNEGLRKALALKPDAIILDSNLPTMSGFVVTKKIRSNEILKDIPIVMLSSGSQDTHANKSYILGVDEYMSMPVNLDSVYNKVENQLNLYN